MSELYGRVVALQIDNTEYTDFRIDFSIEKDLNGEPNSAEVSIYNLSYDTAMDFIDRGRESRIRILAGYQVPALLFEGNPMRGGVEYTQSGPDRILKIKAQEGLVRYQKARVRGTYDKPITYNELIDDILRQAGISRSSARVEIEGGDQLLPPGRVIEGRAAEVLDSLCETLGAQWSFDGNDRISIVGRTLTRRNSGLRFATELRNILDTPKPKDNKGVEIRVLLSDIQPGDRFVIDSLDNPRWNGTYKAISVNHRGSAWDTDFSTIIEGRPYEVPT